MVKNGVFLADYCQNLKMPFKGSNRRFAEVSRVKPIIAFKSHNPDFLQDKMTRIKRPNYV